MVENLGVIPDGNRRYAEQQDISYAEAYQKGIDTVEDLIKWSYKEDVKNLVVYGLSLQNFKKRASVPKITELFKENIQRIIRSPLLYETRTKVVFAGKWLEGMVNEIIELEEATEDFSEHKLYLLLNYSGKEEIRRAMGSDFDKYLEVPVDLDLVIRSGGRHRLSGFCPLQSSYAELFFSDVLWPDFTEDDFKKAVDFYRSVPRTFGA